MTTITNTGVTTTDLTVDTNTIKVDSANNRVGIGTTSPTQTLETAGDILINTTGNPSLTVKTSGAGNNPFVRIQADTNYWDLQSLFSNTNDELDFRYNGTSKMMMTKDGVITKPNQPSFHANKNGHLAEANATNQIQSWTTVHDIGSNFNATTGVFTAPVAGVYFFAMNWMHNNPAGDMQLHGKKNSSVVIKANQTAAGATWNQDYLAAVYQMSANDTWSWHLYSTGTSTYGVYGSGTFTSCNGYLIG